MRIAEISLPAIRHNVRRIREVTGGTVIAVIKADGYGHGATSAARAALDGGATLLGVTDLEEALSLRDRGVDAPILCWLHGVRADFEAAVTGGIELGVSHRAQLEALAAAARRVGQVATLQFKVDTGLSRNGASESEWPELFARAVELERQGSVRIRGIFSHLANAGEAADLAQGVVFDRAVHALRSAGAEPELIHLAASAATFSRPTLHYNTVRVGVTIYGLSPYADRTSADLGLIPAMTLRSEIVGLRDVTRGTGVSYGYNHVTERDTTLALVPVGYGDGMPRALNGEHATVAIAGQHFPIIGRIGMDQCIIDIGPIAGQVTVGEPVVFFGDPATGAPPIEAWAERMHTINYEIVVSIGSRVVRVEVDDVPATVEGVDEDVLDAPGFGAGSGFGSGSGTVPVRDVPHVVAHRYEADDPDEMHAIGVRLGEALRAGDLVILTGPLGAGKTTLTRGIGEGLGVRGPVTSPTFVLARTHPSLGDGPPLIHVDAYRLGDAGELDDLDLDFDGSVVVAEWGAGMLDERDSWVEIVIERPTGAGAGAGGAAGAGAGDAAGAGGAAHGAAGSAADALAADLVELRHVTITGHGPRWANGVL